MRRISLALCTLACCALYAVMLSADASADTSGGSGMSFSELLSVWANALLDPATYTTVGHIDGFLTFLMNETFLSYLSSDSIGSLTGSTIMESIPNIFFIVSVLCVIISLAVAVIDIKRAEKSRKVLKKKN